jgi:flagellar basal-body rod protein FlgC
MSSFNVFDIAGSGMSAESVRLNTVASNLANADSVSGDPSQVYQAKHPVFQSVQALGAAALGAATLRAATLSMAAPGSGSLGAAALAATSNHLAEQASASVKVSGIAANTAAPEARYDPSNPLANSDGYVYSSNVNVVEEMTDMISASRSYQNNVEVMNTARNMMLDTLKLGQS